MKKWESVAGGLRVFLGAAMLCFAGCEPGAKDSDLQDRGEEVSVPTPEPKPTENPATPEPTPTPVPTPTPEPTPTPFPYIPRKNVDVTRFYNGVTIESELITAPVDLTAAVERNRLDSYVLEMNLRIRIPQAARTLEELKKNDPKIDSVFPGLPGLLSTAAVSPEFEVLYTNKVNYIRPRLGRLEEILSKHNFYDCDTILELQHPVSGRKALFVSADMDLNVDGSDGDRNVTIDGSSQFFQPQTSYRWPKQTERPNQFLARTEERLAEVRAELKTDGLTAERRKSLQGSEETLRNRLLELRRWSFLISDTDPYIVLPGFMFRSEDRGFRPRFGDYAVVLYDGKVFPAILGDAGPSFKMGEASMRLCREINPKTSGLLRAVSNIRVAYVVFPGTADEVAGPPDIAKWNAVAGELFSEIGGDVSQLHEWEDLVPPWPTPTPSPTPEPAPSATPDEGGQIVDSPAPEASPSPTTNASQP